MSVIRVLPEKVASQIAAGEVIERPACVVRELLDNAVDAGADRISIRIEKGGKAMVRVSDNGTGMTRDDLLLCTERHATSKIRETEDLFSVRSLGFRGEALPSIASVSRMTLTTRTKEHVAGYRLRIAGGKLLGIEEAGTPPGTIVEVEDVFYNTPVRRKFLKAARTEMDYIVDAVYRASVPRCEVGFVLEEGGKTVCRLPAAREYRSRLSVLLGRRIAEAMKEAEEEHAGFTVRVFAAPGEFARSRADRLFVYVNGRNIRDRFLTKAVAEGYGQRLMKGRYPQAVIFLEIAPDLVDVNVHPTKQEVRFHEDKEVFRGIEATVEKALGGGGRVAGRPGRYPEGKEMTAFPAKEVPEPYRGTSRLSMEGPEAAPREAPMVRDSPHVIGQLHDTYILCEDEKGLKMVDQHAAHERIVYEQLKKGAANSRMEIQMLLVPQELELTLREKRVALERAEDLAGMGIELDHFGGNTFLLRSVPAILSHIRWDVLVPELVAEMDKSGSGEGEVLDRVLTVMACHGSVRAGKRLSREEMSDLLIRLEETDLPANCPHGRPVSRHLTYYEIQKMFKRVV